MSNKIRNRALAILLISLIGCCFTGGVLVNAQAEEVPTTDDRLENIEKLLEELIETQDEMQTDLDNMHESYVTREIFDIKIKGLKETNTVHFALLCGIFFCVFAPYFAPTISRWRNKEPQSTKSV